MEIYTAYSVKKNLKKISTIIYFTSKKNKKKKIVRKCWPMAKPSYVDVFLFGF